MLSVTVYNETGQQVGSEQIDENLLGGEVNERLLKQAVVMYHANQRQGTVAQKTRGEVEGSTRKIYKQKGTGRARMGPVRQPVRRGGGRAFPRKPRDFRKDMPKKMRRLARNQAVLVRIKSNDAIIVDGLRFDEPKTKRFASLLKAVNAGRGCVFATRGVDANLHKSGRNIPKTQVCDVAELNAFDILLRKRLVFTRDAFAAFCETAGEARPPQTEPKPDAGESKTKTKPRRAVDPGHWRAEFGQKAGRVVMDIYHTIIRPLVTEKSTHQSQVDTEKDKKKGKDQKKTKEKAKAKAATKGGTYAFQVHTDATKPQIKDAVEKIYNVTVVDVRTMNCESRARRSRFRMGHKEHTKKAIVVVDPNSHIDLF